MEAIYRAEAMRRAVDFGRDIEIATAASLACEPATEWRLRVHPPPNRPCLTARDFVPWRFSDAGLTTVWMVSKFRAE
jgi:hypothetical protein